MAKSQYLIYLTSALVILVYNPKLFNAVEWCYNRIAYHNKALIMYNIYMIL